MVNIRFNGSFVKNVTTTNKASESDFAILDLLLRTKQMQTLFCLSMWARKHTSEWLNNKDAEEKDRTLNLARVKNHEKYKDRVEGLKLMKKEKNTCKTERERKSSGKAIKNAVNADAVNSPVLLGVRAWLSEEESKTEILVVNEEMRKAVLQAKLAFFQKHP